MKKIWKVAESAMVFATGAVVLFLLATIIFPKFNYSLIVIRSGSMESAVKTGSVLLNVKRSDYKEGDIITFRKNEKTKAPITHRVYGIRIEKGKPIYITKGDANNAPDLKEVLPENVIGKMLFSIPFAGYAINAAKKPLGFTLIIVVPAIIIIGGEAKKIREEIRARRAAKKEEINNQNS